MESLRYTLSVSTNFIPPQSVANALHDIVHSPVTAAAHGRGQPSSARLSFWPGHPPERSLATHEPNLRRKHFWNHSEYHSYPLLIRQYLEILEYRFEIFRISFRIHSLSPALRSQACIVQQLPVQARGKQPASPSNFLDISIFEHAKLIQSVPNSRRL